jgi:hypothetical protein
MYVDETGCCAVDEIHELSVHGSAEEAMIGFIRAVYDSDRGYDLDEHIFSAFYIFTGVVKQPGSNPKYGPRFAAYIKRHKLGVVTESVARPNRVNHPDHVVKVWVWATSQRGLEAWARKKGL